MTLDDISYLPVSPIQTVQIYGRNCFVKRDDLIGPINGNKARKLYSLLKLPPESIQEIMSCGGNQSNLMYALSILAQNKGWKFTYVTPHLPEWLKKAPSGNYKTAIDNNTLIIEINSSDLNSHTKAMAEKSGALFIPQGAHCEMAEEGLIHLAKELKTQLAGMGNPDVDILLSSGTGTTAFYLARHMPQNRIVTFACVSGIDYLKDQMRELGEIPSNIVFLEAENKIPFGETNLELSDTYYELHDQGIEVDLIYDAAFWTFIKHKWMNNQPIYPGPGQRKILYIHSGGLHGNSSQLNRYKRKYPFVRTWRTF